MKNRLDLTFRCYFVNNSRGFEEGQRVSYCLSLNEREGEKILPTVSSQVATCANKGKNNKS